MSGHPYDWVVTRLGDVLEFQVGFPFESRYFVTSPTGPRLVRNRDLRSDDSVVYYTGQFSPSYLVTSGDVLIGMDGDFSPCVWRAGRALLNQRVGRLRASERTSQRYLAFAVSGPLKELEGATGATTVKHLSHRDVESIVLPLPPRAEQERIASALENSDALIAGLERMLAKKEAIKQGVMQELLSGNTRLPGFTGKWTGSTVGAVGDVKTGPFGSSLHERDYVSTGTPIITVEHLGERGVEGAGAPMVSDVDSLRLRAYRLIVGDVVFSRVGSIDRNALVSPSESGWLFSGRLLRVRFDSSRADPGFMSAQFHSRKFTDAVRAVAVGQTMASLNTTILKGIAVDLPPIDEQRAIGQVYSDVNAELDVLETRLCKAMEVKQGMMQELLSGRTRLPSIEEAA